MICCHYIAPPPDVKGDRPTPHTTPHWPLFSKVAFIKILSSLLPDRAKFGLSRAFAQLR